MMAVQPQLPSSDAFPPDFRHRRASNGAVDDPQMIQDRRNLLQLHDNLGLSERPIYGIADGNCAVGRAGKQQQQQHRQTLNNAMVFSDPQSVLTCNALGSRKRAREEAMAPQPGHQDSALAAPPFMYPNTVAVSAKPDGGVLPQSRLLQSGAVSTSGRHASPSPAVVSPLARDLVSLFYQQQCLEIDALVRLQSERLRAGMEEAGKRQCRALLSVLEQQAAKRLMAEEAELESASRRNAELEEKVRRMNEENQVWFSVARNNEAMVCNLRASLEAALLHHAIAGGREGFGDGEGAALPADDAQSCCFEEAEGERLQRRRACRECGEREVCVVLLPCRHLCLCKDCESKVVACPVCGITRNASLQVFLC